MKIPVLFLLLIGAATAGYAQTRPVVTDTAPELKAVTLYLNRTELTHQGSLTLPAGTSRVQIRGIARYDEGTLEINLGEGAELLTVGDDTESSAAADSLTANLAELEKIAATLQGLEEEKTFLLANRVIPAGSSHSDWSDEVERGARRLRNRLPEIQLETNKLLKQQEKLRTLTAASTRRAAATAASLGAERPLLMSVRATQPVTVPLTVRYAFSSEDSWQPLLEIRADESGREVQFVTNAQVRNLSRLPWQRVRLVLVNQLTENDVSKPRMEPWALSSRRDIGSEAGEGRIDQFVVKGTAAGRPVDVTQSTRYEVPEAFTLAPNSQRELTLPVLRLTGKPEYLALPKLTEKVYRQTKVTGWEGLQLPESAQVFYRGSYVGRTALDSRAYNDSLEVSIGYDDRIVVGRTKLEDFTRKTGLGGTHRRVHLTYELNVRNLHAEPVRLQIQDQVPVSSEKDIEVKVLEVSGAERDERTGKLTWHLRLPANSSQRLRFSFDIEYPQGRNLGFFRRRATIKSPKFR